MDALHEVTFDRVGRRYKALGVLYDERIVLVIGEVADIFERGLFASFYGDGWRKDESYLTTQITNQTSFFHVLQNKEASCLSGRIKRRP